MQTARLDSVQLELAHERMVQQSMMVLQRALVATHVKYRIVGSLLIAAIHGKPHRPLGDIDVIISEEDLPTVLDVLRAEGFRLTERHAWGFRWLESAKDDHLHFTFLLVGTFEKNCFSYKLSKHIVLHIDNAFLAETTYALNGISFTGIPVVSICEGLRASSLNPKRKRDRQVMQSQCARHQNGMRLDKAFTVYWHGMKLPKAYVFFSWLYNLYGGLRVLLGKRYETW